MSLSELQKHAAALNPNERRQLAAFLTQLRMKETCAWEGAMEAEAIPRSRWISLEEAKRRLGS